MTRRTAGRRFDDDFEDIPQPRARRGSAVEDEDVAQQPPADPLYAVYGIFPTMPVRVKVEKLLMGWSMDAEDIAALLDQDIYVITRLVNELETKWATLGEALSDQEQKIERGKYLSELQATLKDVNEAYNSTKDIKLLNTKINLMEKITKLKGIDTDKRPNQAVDDGSGKKTLEDKIKTLTPEQLKGLHEKLRGAAVTPEESE